MLSESELSILQAYLEPNEPHNGYCRYPLLLMASHTEILTYLNAIPAPLNLGQLTLILTNSELANYLGFRSKGVFHNSFGTWLSYFFDHPIAPALGKSSSEIETMARMMVNDLTNYRINRNQDFQSVVHEIFDRSLFSTLTYGLHIAISDTLLSETTGYRILVEMGVVSNKLRWQSLGLSELPTLEEIATLLN
jgi:hypothetical protein